MPAEELPELDPEKIDQRGGATVITPSLGVSGAGVMGRVAYMLRNRGGGYGLVALCVGVGLGLAVVLEGRPDQPHQLVVAHTGLAASCRSATLRRVGC